MPKANMVNVTVYTDGSLRRTKCGIVCGYGVHFANNVFPDIYGPFENGNITNNRAELYAIYIAIKSIVGHCVFETMTIYTDSEYCQKSLTLWIKKWKDNDWKNAQKKPVENQDIIRKIDRYLQKYDNIKILWIRSHSKKNDIHSKGNAIADSLANKGADMFVKHSCDQ